MSPPIYSDPWDGPVVVGCHPIERQEAMGRVCRFFLVMRVVVRARRIGWLPAVLADGTAPRQTDVHYVGVIHLEEISTSSHAWYLRCQRV